MRILFITNGFPPARWAGTEIYTANIAKELISRGHIVHILCCGDWDRGSRYWNGYVENTYQEIPIRRLNLNWQKSPDTQKYLYNNPVVGNHLSQYLRDIQPDLVHVTSCETLSASVLDVVKQNQIPLVLSITDFWFLCPRIDLLKSDGENCSGITRTWDCLRCMARNSKVYRWPGYLLPEKSLENLLTKISHFPVITRLRGLRGVVSDIADRKSFLRHVFSLPDVRLVASKFVRDVYAKNGFCDSIQLHPYGHDVSWLRYYAARQESSTINIGFIGQIAYSKGVHILLEAARRLVTLESKKLNFLIYGNLHKHTEYGSYLQQLAQGVDNIQFCGTYRHERSAEVFSQIDILVVPSLWYDFPLVIYEAFATKTPVVATNLGGMAEAVSHEASGLLFERGNVDDLVRQIQRVVHDPELRQKLKSGVPMVKAVTAEALELEEIYMDLIQRKVKSVI